MRIASGLISWLSMVAQTILSIVLLTNFEKFYKMLHNVRYVRVEVPYWAWIIFAVVVFLRLLLLVLRPAMLAAGSGGKVGAGILIMFFISFLGGLLTCFIPDSEINGEDYDTESLEETPKEVVKYIYVSKSPDIYTSDSATLTTEEAKIAKNDLAAKFKKGEISQSEYINGLKDVDSRTLKL